MRTIELSVLCEGQTELEFVTRVLGPHLRIHHIYAKASLLQPTGKGGGIIAHGTLMRDVGAELGRSRPHQFVTTMVDLYALPKDFPGHTRVGSEMGAHRAERIERLMKKDLGHPRFLPYIQVHEFEALVFVDLEHLIAQFPDGMAKGAPERIRREARGLAPEDVDDGPMSAPSKRIVRVLPAYAARKSIAGAAITAQIGLPRLRAACPHFNGWVTELEGLSPSTD